MDKIQKKRNEESRKLAEEIMELLSGHKASEAYLGICLVLAVMVKTGDMNTEHIQAIPKNVEQLVESLVLKQKPKK
jgi:hypothetical protein